MSLTSGNAPTTPGGTPTQLGWAPGVGPVPIQLGTPTGDSTQGANNQQSAPQVVQIASGQAVAPIDGQKATYRASIQGLVAVTGCTDLFTITGSSTKTIRVTRFEFSGTVATAALYIDVQGIVRSTANTSGTKTNPTAVPLDSSDAAASAVVAAYTANPTTGTSVGTITSDKAFLSLTGTPTTPDRLTRDFGNRPGARAIVLRGATQVFALNLNAVTLANATSIDCAIEWTEE